MIEPVVRLLTKLGPGDPDIDPWDDLAAYGEVVRRPALLDIYFVYTVSKR